MNIPATERSAKVEQFGSMPNGDPVSRITITKGKLAAKIITYGASLQDLRLQGHAPSLVLGFKQFEPYLSHRYFGAMVGRVANRIDHAHFELDGKTCQLQPNNGVNLLHGGVNSIDRQNWQIVSATADSVTLTCIDKESETGFPGDCEITCTYRIDDNQTLALDISANCAVPTLCNIAHHSYFNLFGTGTILDHQVQLLADHYLPVNEQLIPTGEIASVENTDFDFRVPRPIRPSGLINYDNNFCLTKNIPHEPKFTKPIAMVFSPASGVRMDVRSTEPGVQFYTGENLAGEIEGVNGEKFLPFTGLALEPQGWPDAPNHPNFPSIRLDPGHPYHQQSTFSFSIGEVVSLEKQ